MIPKSSCMVLTIKKKTSCSSSFFMLVILEIKLRLTIPWRVFQEPDRLTLSSHLLIKWPTISTTILTMIPKSVRIVSPPLISYFFLNLHSTFWDNKALFSIYKWEEVNIMAIICIFKEDEEDEEEDSSKKED